MARELRITIAVVVVLIAASPAIFADAPAPRTASYLALVFHQLPPTRVPIPSATPSRTPAPTNTPTSTNTPAPSNTPGPTLTPTQITFDIPPVQPPCNKNVPSQINPGANAWMTVPIPSRFSQTTICARYIIETIVDRGAILKATAHYRTTDTDLGIAFAGSDGVAHLTFNIGNATPGYTVIVDGTISGHPFSTSFTPPQ